MLKTKTSSLVESFYLRCKVDGLSERTIKAYSDVITSFERFLGSGEIENTTPTQVRAFLFTMKDRGVSSAYVAYHYRHLKAFFNFLVRENILLSNPMQAISKPKLPAQFPHVLEEHQVVELLREAKKRKAFEGIRDYTMILTFLDTGIRLGELANLGVSDVNLTNRSLSVKGKGDKQRTVYMGFSLVRAFLKYIGLRNQMLKKYAPYTKELFVGRKGEALKLRNIEQIIQRLAQKTGIEGVRVSPHTFRHTSLTAMVRNGMNPFAVQQIAGHSQITTTMIYVHMVGKNLQEQQEKYSPLDNLCK